MKRTAILAALLVACGGGGSGDAPDARPDAPPLVQSDRDYVLTRLVLPTTNEEADAAAFVFPGRVAPSNKMGRLIVLLIDLLEGIPVQADLDANMAASTSLQIFRIHSNDPAQDDPLADAHWADVDDADEPADGSNDFGGAGQFVLESGGALQTFADATVTAGAIEGTGETSMFVLGLPLLTGEPVTRVTNLYPQLRGTIDEEGFTIAIGGALTEEELHTVVYPPIATLLTRALMMDTPNAGSITTLFDANDDDEVTVEELIGSATLDSLASPDVDLDGDQTFDHISACIQVEAVRAELLSP